MSSENFGVFVALVAACPPWPLDGNEVVPVVVSSVTHQTTIADIVDFALTPPVVIGSAFDTLERYASLNAFGTNAPPGAYPGGLIPPGQPAIMARNGMIADIIYGYMNVPVDPGSPSEDGAGLKLRLIGDPYNPDVITELAFGRYNTNLVSNADITVRSFQDVQLIANYKGEEEGGGPFTGLSLLQDGSAELFDLASNYLNIAPALVALSSGGSNCDLEISSGAVLRLQAFCMVHISSATDDVNLTAARSFNVGVGMDINLIAGEIINLAAPAIRCNTPMHGFFGAPPVTQPTAGGVTTAGFIGGSGDAVHVDSTFTGNIGSTKYTIGDIVAALKQLGLIAM